MTCKHCGKAHSEKYHLAEKLNDKGFPKTSKHYQEAHQEADRKEKRAYPKGYEKMKKIDAKLEKHELAGKNLKTGKIEVSKKVPPALRKEVAYHEKVENKKLRKR